MSGPAPFPRRELVGEEPVALVFQAETLAVMMATPADLEDLALGFALSEGIVAGPDEIESIEIVSHDAGTEARLWLSTPRAGLLAERRRAMVGPVGCGLCGIDSLEAANRPLPALPPVGPVFSHAEIADATALLRARQPLHDRTGAAHAAGFLRPGLGLGPVREDVGRHNALDKLLGALSRAGIAPRDGAVVLTSRVSTELVQKCAQAGCAVLVAASAPTARAARLAEEAGMTLATFARAGRFELRDPVGRVLARAPTQKGTPHVA
ncbi:MAG: formate dehydrogenase accessory sulfurtransferase FdhD [Rhodobacteraceae bacterium]|nr:formate dehydrogenase accessory sulfurtransferase FdhD [Paracoccaceae bacterium]